MGTADRPFAFRAIDVALFRAPTLSGVAMPSLPEYSESVAASGITWLREVWANDETEEALRHIAPSFAARVDSLVKDARPDSKATLRAMMTTIRYLQRLRRPTPIGHIAGVAMARLGGAPQWDWRATRTAVGQPAAAWLNAVIGELERNRDVLPNLMVMANSAMFIRGNHIVVPYLARGLAAGDTPAIDVQLRHTQQARRAIEAANQPILFSELSDAMQLAFPQATPLQVTTMLAALVDRQALLTSLRPTSTESDPLGYLLHQLHAARIATIHGLGETVQALATIHAGLKSHNRLPASESSGLRQRIVADMDAIVHTEQHPLAIDTRLHSTATLPIAVIQEIERAARALAILSSQPFGSPAWKDYHQRFYERFSIGSLVPIADVVADSGIGWPDGYPGTGKPAPERPLAQRDLVLLELAQAAVLDGRDEVNLDEDLIRRLDKSDGKTRPPGHLEIRFRVNATDVASLQRGDFTVEVVSVSNGAGILLGRFLSILEPADREKIITQLGRIPTTDSDTVLAQVSFPPLRPADAHVARTTPVHPLTISVAEHQPAGDAVLHLSDLAIGCDGKRLYLAAPERGHRIEAVGMHALNLRLHTPPFARLLLELSRAQNTQVTTFDWGPAAVMPYLPRVTYGRIILAPARWRINRGELPNRQSSWHVWESAWQELHKRRRIPQHVRIVEPDSSLPLDLSEPWHRAMLREQLGKRDAVVLTEAPSSTDNGWCDGTPHEFVVPLTCDKPTAWPRLPLPTIARVIGRNHGEPSATSNILTAKLYGDLGRQTELLTEHLHALWSEWQPAPQWWYLRYRDPGQHIRLRIKFGTPEDFGSAAARVSQWGAMLHRIGLLSEVVYPTTYRETGRWGSGAAMCAAEAVFGHDSRAVIAQLSTGLGSKSSWPHWQALVAAQTVDMAAAFTGSIHSGMRWLIEHIPQRSPARLRRDLLDAAVTVCDPRDGWEALRGLKDGQQIVEAWRERDKALSEYRRHFPGSQTQGINVHDVLGSLLHAHFVRSRGIDFDAEAMCLYLARSAAMAHIAQAGKSR